MLLFLKAQLITKIDPIGSRTRVSGVRGQRPRPLDDGTKDVFNYGKKKKGEARATSLIYPATDRTFPLSDAKGFGFGINASSYTCSENSVIRTGAFRSNEINNQHCANKF